MTPRSSGPPVARVLAERISHRAAGKALQDAGVKLGTWYRIGPFRDQGPLLNWMDNVASSYAHVFDPEKDALAGGVMAGYPVIGIKVELLDGSYHDVDSSEMAFRMAGSMAFKQGMRKALGLRSLFCDRMLEMELNR